MHAIGRTQTDKVRVLLADDHTILRQGVRLLLENEPDFTVVGEAGDGSQAITLALELDPDIIVLDVSMPGLGAVETVERLRQVKPATKILILTMYDRDEYIFDMMNAGADGYVLKDVAAEQLVHALRSVMQGRSVLYPDFSPAVVQALFSHSGRRQGAPTLTRREEEVLRLVSQGLTNQEVADRLVVSIKTVQTHRGHLMKKLGLHDRVGLVRYAIRHGLCEP